MPRIKPKLTSGAVQTTAKLARPIKQTTSKRIATYTKYVQALRAGDIKQAKKDFVHFIRTQCNSKKRIMSQTKLIRYIHGVEQLKFKNQTKSTELLDFISQTIEEALNGSPKYKKSVSLPNDVSLKDITREIKKGKAVLNKDLQSRLPSPIEMGHSEIIDIEQVMAQVRALMIKGQNSLAKGNDEQARKTIDNLKRLNEKFGLDAMRVSQLQILSPEEKKQLESIVDFIDALNTNRLRKALHTSKPEAALKILTQDLLPGQLSPSRVRHTVDMDKILTWTSELEVAIQNFIADHDKESARISLKGLELIRDKLGINEPQPQELKLLSPQEIQELKYTVNSAIQATQAELRHITPAA